MKNIFIKAVAAVLACAAVAACGCADSGNAGNAGNTGNTGNTGGGGDLPMVTTDGEKLVDEQGNEVIMRGINAGGLFVTEHWMTGFNKSNPKNDYLSLSRTFISRFGEEDTKRLWEEYRSNWWTEEDFENCAEMGINVIRLPFTYMNVDFAAITDLENAGQSYDFSALDEFVEAAAEHGIYTILDLHGAYGSQNGQDHSGQIFDTAEEVTFYENEQLISLTVKLWGALAEHFRTNSNVIGYDILNEPGEKAGLTEKRHWDCFDRIYDAIRATGDRHIVIFESCWDGANLPQPSEYGWETCIYSFHHYSGDNISYEQFCESWDSKIAEIESWDFGVPLYMGEFTAYGKEARWWDYALSLLNEHGWHWTSWTYKVWGSMAWGVVNVPNDGAYKVNPDDDGYEDILAKFEHLDTSGCVRYTFSDGRTLFEIIDTYSGGATA